MANTIKFGNGQWATKKDSILAYNDENSNFKPLPFVTSRASTATRVNKAGLLETVASGVPRVDYLGNSKGSYLLEPSSTNLITQSESFGNSYWTKSGASIEGDASTAGSEQVTNGDFATDSDWDKQSGWSISGGTANSDGSGNFKIYQQVPFQDGKTYKITFDVTAISQGSVRLFVNLPTFTQLLHVYDVGTYSITVDIRGGAQSIQFFSTNNFIGSIDNVSAKEVQGFASPSADTPLGAFKLVENTSTSEHGIYSPSITLSLVDNSYTFYVKKGGRTWVRGFVLNKGGVFFDLQNGVIGNSHPSITPKITKLPDEWYRCEMKFNELVGGERVYITLAQSNNVVSYQGDGTSGVYIFGAQLEQKSYATSYIKTSGSQITRLADTASQTVPDGIINSSEGVLYFESKGFSDRDNGLITLSDGTNSNRLGINFPSVGIINCFCFTASSFKFNINFGGQVQNSLNKIAFSWGGGNYKVYINGILKSSFMADSPLASVFNKIAFNQGSSTSGKFQGDAKDLRVYNTALTDAELAKLTKI